MGNKIDEINAFMENSDILIAAIQETKLSARSNFFWKTVQGKLYSFKEIKERTINRDGGLTKK